jgi:signal peptidase II
MKRWLALPCFFVLIFFDQMTKYLAQIYLKDKESISLIDGVFELHYLENKGAAFGILQNRGMVFIMLTAVFLILAVLFYGKLPTQKKFDSMRWLILLITAGAAGNMIDRILRGYVIDFFYFSLINFPVFNIADCYVTLSVFCFVLLIFFGFTEEELEEMSLWKRQ